jgi:rRNA maturation RNase YbeY
MISCLFEEIAPIKVSSDLLALKTTYIIDNEGFIEGEIVLIFCSDAYLLEINKKHLNHDYFTDIITFSYVNDEVISGDLFISLDRVKENAANLSCSFERELERVVYHGVLHLCGYNDKNPLEKAQMRLKEDFYLSHIVSRET